MEPFAGSSPLTRGKRRFEGRRDRDVRLIPAHAGKTRRGWMPRCAPAAHPRSRGENALPCWPPPRPTGSSPLTRGKPEHPNYPRFEHGLIPAHAGKTVRRARSCVSRAAHPRSRGENSRMWSILSGASGSSPLTRGKRLDCFGCRRVCRLIPAHAGKTTAPMARRILTRAHPRSRGENTTARRLGRRR